MIMNDDNMKKNNNNVFLYYQKFKKFIRYILKLIIDGTTKKIPKDFYKTHHMFQDLNFSIKKLDDSNFGDIDDIILDLNNTDSKDYIYHFYIDFYIKNNEDKILLVRWILTYIENNFSKTDLYLQNKCISIIKTIFNLIFILPTNYQKNEIFFQFYQNINFKRINFLVEPKENYKISNNYLFNLKINIDFLSNSQIKNILNSNFIIQRRRNNTMVIDKKTSFENLIENDLSKDKNKSFFSRLKQGFSFNFKNKIKNKLNLSFSKNNNIEESKETKYKTIDSSNNENIEKCNDIDNEDSSFILTINDNDNDKNLENKDSIFNLEINNVILINIKENYINLKNKFNEKKKKKRIIDININNLYNMIEKI